MIYAADIVANNFFELYSVTVDGSEPPIRLTPDLVSSGNIIQSPQISADSQNVFYIADQTADSINSQELYSVPIIGGASMRVNGNLPASSQVDSFLLNASNDYVVYAAVSNLIDGIELFSSKPQETELVDELCVPIKATNENIAVICL